MAWTETGTLIDNGFEDGTDGSTLSATYWSSLNSPGVYEYDTAEAKIGTRSALTTGTGTYGGFVSDVSDIATVCNQNGCEMRWWVKFSDTTSTTRRIMISGNVTGIFYLIFGMWNDNVIASGYNGTPITGYSTGNNPIGTFTTNWTQFRYRPNFTTKFFTLDMREELGASWTPLRSATAPEGDNNIPFQNDWGDDTALQYIAFQGYDSSPSYMWVDDVRYSATAITESEEGEEPSSTPAFLIALYENGTTGSRTGTVLSRDDTETNPYLIAALNAPYRLHYRIDASGSSTTDPSGYTSNSFTITAPYGFEVNDVSGSGFASSHVFSGATQNNQELWIQQTVQATAATVWVDGTTYHVGDRVYQTGTEDTIYICLIEHEAGVVSWAEDLANERFISENLEVGTGGVLFTEI